MNLKEILEKFAEMQEYAESNNTNASLWWHYFEAGQTYKFKCSLSIHCVFKSLLHL